MQIDQFNKIAISSSFEFDCITRKIIPKDSMRNVRFEHVLIELDDIIYAIGGRAINGGPQ